MKKFLSIAVVAFILAAMLIPTVYATENNLLRDNAGLLDESEGAEVEDTLTNVSNKHDTEVVVLTVEDYETYFKDNYNQDFYDIDSASEYYCKNIIENNNNVLFLQSTDERDWCIASNGKGHDVFNAYVREYIGSAINEDLHDGDYEDAYLHYAKYADEFMTEAEKGNLYDANHPKMTAFDYVIRFGVPIVAGVIVGLIAVFAVKSKYKPVKLKAEANDYLIQGSLQLHQSYDRFLYTHTTRTRRQKSNSSGSSHDSGSFGSTSGKY